jgi:hypothetical protein
MLTFRILYNVNVEYFYQVCFVNFLFCTKRILYRIELYGYTGDNRIDNENEIPENTSTVYKNTNN